jgi:hypothetical protein
MKKEDKAPEGPVTPEGDQGAKGPAKPEESSRPPKVGPQRPKIGHNAANGGEDPEPPKREPKAADPDAAAAVAVALGGPETDEAAILRMAGLARDWVAGAQTGALEDGVARLSVLRYRMERAFAIASGDFLKKKKAGKAEMSEGKRVQQGERVMTVAPAGKHTIPGRKYQPPAKSRQKAGSPSARRG